MERTLTVTSGSALVHPADPERNLQSVSQWARQAADRDADLVLFPEYMEVR